MRSGFGWRHICPVLQQAQGRQEHPGKESTGKHSQTGRASLPQQPQDLSCSTVLVSSVLVLMPNFATFRAIWGRFLLPPVIMKELAGQQRQFPCTEDQCSGQRAPPWALGVQINQAYDRHSRLVWGASFGCTIRFYHA